MEAAQLHHAVDRGTRKFHKRLRVPQWESVKGEPPVTITPSQAAILFDVAYASSLQHHALVMAMSKSLEYVPLFTVSAIPTVFNWWSVSLFLCKYDPGDIINELVLMAYMVLVIGQSLTLQECADCIATRNLEYPCPLNRVGQVRAPDGTYGTHYYGEREAQCSVWGGDTAAQWPMSALAARTRLCRTSLPRTDT